MAEKPFIKLFRSPYHGYFYDINRDEVVRVEEDIYQYLKAEQEGSILPDDPGILQKIEEYRAFGYLSSRRVSRMEHSATATLPIVLSRCVSSMTLQVTQDCNLNCAYCVYHGGEVNPL